MSRVRIIDTGLLSQVEAIRDEMARIVEIASDEALGELFGFAVRVGELISATHVACETLPSGETRYVLTTSEELAEALEALRRWQGDGPIFSSRGSES